MTDGDTLHGVIPDITIASLRIAQQILLDLEKRRRFRFLISIGDPQDKDDEDLPKGYTRFDGPRLRLCFDDVSKASEAYQMASMRDVEQLIDFCAEIDGPALIHCYAGISRSAAAACILAAIKLGPGKEERALRHVARLKPSVFPNKHVLNLADQMLDRRGKLLSAAFELWPQPLDSIDIFTIPTIPSRKVAKAR